jgi:SAM-dependent methyltransferase
MPVVLESASSFFFGRTLDLLNRSGLILGHTVIDLGCGPGLSSLELSDFVGPTGRVIAVEPDEALCERLSRLARDRGKGNISVFCCPLEDVWQVEDGVADLVFSRFSLSRSGDAPGAVAEARRLLRAGGVFCVMDWFSVATWDLQPPSLVWKKILRLVLEGWEQCGTPNVGQLLPALLHSAGFALGEMSTSIDVVKGGSMKWAVPTQFFEAHLTALGERGFLTRLEVNEFTRMWEDRSKDPTAFYCPPVLVEVIARMPTTAGREAAEGSTAAGTREVKRKQQPLITEN